jgi:carbamoyltransferase
MLETCEVISPFGLPAITHVDRSARLQTVDARSSSRFACLLAGFAGRTGCPILLNTSFNMRGEPIVCTPEDALLCFARSRIDALVIEDFIIDRDALPSFWSEMVALRRGPEASGVGHKVYTLL